MALRWITNDICSAWLQARLPAPRHCTEGSDVATASRFRQAWSPRPRPRLKPAYFLVASAILKALLDSSASAIAQFAMSRFAKAAMTEATE